MSVLTEALNRIFNWLQQYNPNAASALEPGLTYDEIQEMVKYLPFKLPEEVYELYQWRNGSNLDGLTFIFDAMELLPLEKTVNFYKRTTQTETYFFPLFFSEGDLKYCEIVLKEKFNQYPTIFSDFNQYSMVFSDAKEPGLVKAGYTSLASMMLTITECYENGAYDLVYDDELNDFIVNNVQKKEIFCKYNSEIIAEFKLKADEALLMLENNLSSEVLNEIGVYLIKDTRAVEPLIQALQAPFSNIADPDENNENMTIRASAASILGDIGDARAVGPLISALQDSYSLTRDYAARSLGKLRDERAVVPLIQTLQDDDQDVRFTAAFALIDLNAVEPLIEALKHNNWRVRQKAAWALGHIGDPSSAESLIETLKDSNSRVREAARQAWAKLILILPELENMIPF
jgi:HEAT repeat protein